MTFGLIEQLNILDRWKTHNCLLSLRAPIGIDSAGMPIMLDIHERAHGPHGLIAGSTGSGKSEFLITYILSLAINYHPDDVNFLLIDYKGGGLAGAFQKGKIKLPHLVGTINNIDTNELQRSYASIQSELRRRQIKFNKARNKTDEGTMDIYKYQRLYHDGIVKEPIPHLLIICDEFAELKQQQEDFMNELISVSRIGRSLGVHLILATQKPAGIINDQIRSNSKFAVCLKVQDTMDSMDVIRKPNAAFLKNTGQFFLQVGSDDYFVLGQSAWAGAPYFPSNTTKKKIDNSIEFISNIGETIKTVDDDIMKVKVNHGEQLTNILTKLYEIAKQEKIEPRQLWLENIPENIYIDEIVKKYNVQKDNDINVYIGEYDDPDNQRQGIVKFNLSKDGNIVIYGNSESGKETLLSTIIYNLITSYTSDEVQFYLLDFGSESLRVFNDIPHIGDIAFVNDEEKIKRFFNMIQLEIQKRKEILSNYNGDYNLYRKSGNKDMPMFIIVLNNYPNFSEAFQGQYEELLQTITREGTQYGILFILTTSMYNDLRYRLTQNFKQKLALQLNNEDDYYNIFNNIGKKRPKRILGRGLICLEDKKIYEFQTAKIIDSSDFYTHIQSKSQELQKLNKTIAKKIPTMPVEITISDVEEGLKGINSIPVGITNKDLSIYAYDFKKNFFNIITSKNIESAVEYSYYLLEEIKSLKNTKIILFDVSEMTPNKKLEIIDKYTRLKIDIELNPNKEKMNYLCVIIGIDKFFDCINYNEEKFYNMLIKAEEREFYNFIIIDSTKKLKNHEYESWFNFYVQKDSGIYVGNGIDNQYLLDINNRIGLVNNCGQSFGYVVNQGNTTFIKLLGVKEKENENE